MKQPSLITNLKKKAHYSSLVFFEFYEKAVHI